MPDIMGQRITPVAKDAIERIALNATLPQITSIKFGEKAGLLATFRQPLTANPTSTPVTHSLRALTLAVDRPIGDDMWIQPLRYNMMQRKGGGGNSVNQSAFSGGHVYDIPKGWITANISSNAREAAPGYTNVERLPILTDADGNKFFSDGIVKLSPGITQVKIPAPYVAQQLVKHSKRPKSGSVISGKYLAYMNECDLFYTSPTDATLAKLVPKIEDTCFVRFTFGTMSYVGAPRTVTIRNGVGGAVIETFPTQPGGTEMGPYKMQRGTKPLVSVSSSVGAWGFEVLIDKYELLDDRRLPSLHRSERDPGDVKLARNGWFAPTAYIKLSVARYVPPQGAIGSPAYKYGTYTPGTPSAITIYSHRYKSPNGKAYWTLDLIER